MDLTQDQVGHVRGREHGPQFRTASAQRFYEQSFISVPSSSSATSDKQLSIVQISSKCLLGCGTQLTYRYVGSTRLMARCRALKKRQRAFGVIRAFGCHHSCRLLF